MQEYTTHSQSTYAVQLANHPTNETHLNQAMSLHAHVEQALSTYLLASEGQAITGLYNTLLAAIEPPLLKVALSFCKTQHEAAKTLGLSRGTLRKKLKQYHLVRAE